MPRKSTYRKNYAKQNPSAMSRFAGGVSSRYKVYKPAAQQLYKDIKYLKNVINVEQHVIDSSETAQAISTTPTLYNLCLVAQGDDYNTRNGRSIKAHRFNIKSQVIMNASATNTVFRFVLFKTNQNQATVPAAEDLFQSIDADCLSQYEAANNQRSFNVLLDRRVVLDSASNTSAMIDMDRALSHHIMYSGVAATEASTGSGALYLMVWSSEAINTPTLAFNSRLRFIDN